METPTRRSTTRTRNFHYVPSPRLRPQASKTPTKQTSKEKATKGEIEENIGRNNMTYIDFQENNINPELIKMVGKKCRHLNLNGLSILASNIPNGEEIHTLSLEKCGLKTLEHFPKLKNLNFLSLANNKLSDLKGLPILPKLERLDLRNNKVEFPVHLAMNAAGAVALNEFNGENVTELDVQSAFKLSPIVSYALRNGRPINSEGADEDQFSFDYLTQDLKVLLEASDIDTVSPIELIQEEDGAYASCPYTADKIKWFMQIADDKKEWQEIEKENGNTVALTMEMRMRLLMCQLTYGDDEYYLYTDQPIDRNTSKLCLSQPLELKIDSAPQEGSIISLFPTEVPIKIAWTDDENTYAKDVTTIEITEDMIDCELKCVVKPYSPSFPKLQFQTIFATSQTVTPKFPTVSQIKFPETIIEGETIKFDHKFYPSNEGDSIIVLEKAAFQYSEWMKVEDLDKDNLEYTPTQDVTDFYLRICYTPITDKGIEGKTTYFYSENKVMPCLPAFSEPFIAGIPKTFYDLAACAQYTGGKKGHCIYTWYASEKEIKPTARSLSKAKKVFEGQIFVPTEEELGMYLYVEMCPVRNDECCGDPVYAGLKEPIDIANPPQTIECNTAVCTNSRVTFEDDFSFFVSDPSAEDGFALVKQGTSYLPSKQHLGKMLRVANNDCDAIIGEIVLPEPKVTHLSLEPIEDGIVRMNIKLKNIKLNNIEIVWFRDVGTKKKAVGVDTPDYVLTPEDVSYSLYAVVKIYDDNHTLLSRTKSEKTPIIRKQDLMMPFITGSMLEGEELSIDSPLEIKSVIWYRSGTNMEEVSRNSTYILQPEDVGHIIKANVTFIHKNNGTGTKAEESTTLCSTDETVQMYFPAVHISVPEKTIEGKLIQPTVESVGGMIEYKSFVYSWDRDVDGEIIHLSDEECYTPTYEDIGAYIQFSAAPLGSDNKTIGQITSLKAGPVLPQEPTVTKVTLKQINNGLLKVTGNYSGGVEGQSIFEWFYIYGMDKYKSITETEENVIQPSEELFKNRMCCMYHPIRDDGVRGKGVMSNFVYVHPLPIIESAVILVKGGRLIAGALLRCKVTATSSVNQTFTWKESVDQKEWKEIPGANEVEFLPTKEQIGKYLMCTIVAYNKHGWESQPFDAFTQLTCGDDTGFVITGENGKDISTVGTVLTANEEGVTWNICEDDEVINQVEDDQYVITADNIGQVIYATKDGFMSNRTKAIHLNSKINAMIKTVVRLGSMNFVANTYVNSISWNCSFGPSGIVLKSKKGTVKEGKWKTLRINCVEQSADLFEIYLDKATKYVLKANLNIEKRNADMIKKADTRDYIVSCIRALSDKYCKTSH